METRECVDCGVSEAHESKTVSGHYTRRIIWEKNWYRWKRASLIVCEKCFAKRKKALNAHFNGIADEMRTLWSDNSIKEIPVGWGYYDIDGYLRQLYNRLYDGIEQIMDTRIDCRMWRTRAA